MELFQTALTQYNLRNYTTARLAFNQLISQYPNSELAPEAQYKLAEILVAQNNLTDALPAFEQVGRLYPTAPKAAEAALQVRGLAGEHQVDGARRALGHAYGGGSQYFSMWIVGSEPH